MTRPGIMTERLVSLFLLGVVAFCSPLLAIFDRPRSVFGVPLLYLYLFCAWLGLLLLTTLAVERGAARESAAEAAGEPDPEEEA